MADTDKNKQIKKRKVTKSEMDASSNQKENRPKSKKITIEDLRHGIAMSKQLLLKKTKNVQNRRTVARDETRICGNGIPLPPLAELEKMYDDSEEELSSISTPQENSTTTESPQIPKLQVNDNKLLSPTSIHIISERLMNIISDISDPNELLNQDVPPPPVIPQKKRKKPEEHYIVGCKERPQVVNKPSTNFCKGDEDYGVDASTAEPDSPPRKRVKKSKIPSYSKSIFNAKCDEIAEKLAKNNDNSEETNYESSDSNKTIEYVPPTILSPEQPSFSPLPSTSRDSETFIRNDELFNQSLRENILKNKTNSPQTTPNKTVNNISTIVIDDDEDDVEVIQTPQTGTNQEITIEDSDDIFSSIQNSTETNNQNNFNNINDHDAYSDITANVGNTEDITEIDVDDVIAQNQAILSKLKRNNELNATITTAVASTNTDKTITQNQNIVNNGNQNNVLNNTAPTPVKPNTNMKQTMPQPNPTSISQATIPSSINSGLNPQLSPTSIPRATIPSRINSGLNPQLNPTSIPRATIPSSINSGLNPQLNPTSIPRATIPSRINSGLNPQLNPTSIPRATIPSSINSGLNLQLNPTSIPRATIPSRINSGLNPTSIPRATIPSRINSGLNPTSIPRATIPSRINSGLNPQLSPTSIPRATIPSSINSGLNPQLNPTSIPRATIPSSIIPGLNSKPFLRIHTTGPSLESLTHIESSLPLTSAHLYSKSIENIVSDFFKQKRATTNTNTVEVNEQCVHSLMKNVLKRLALRFAYRIAVNSPLKPQQDNPITDDTSFPPDAPRNIGECPICMDQFSSTTGIASTICGHVFCLRCIEAAVKVNGRRCPTCRKGLMVGGGYHQIFL